MLGMNDAAELLLMEECLSSDNELFLFSRRDSCDHLHPTEIPSIDDWSVLIQALFEPDAGSSSSSSNAGEPPLGDANDGTGDIVQPDAGCSSSIESSSSCSSRTEEEIKFPFEIEFHCMSKVLLVQEEMIRGRKALGIFFKDKIQSKNDIISLKTVVLKELWYSGEYMNNTISFILGITPKKLKEHEAGYEIRGFLLSLAVNRAREINGSMYNSNEIPNDVDFRKSCEDSLDLIKDFFQSDVKKYTKMETVLKTAVAFVANPARNYAKDRGGGEQNGHKIAWVIELNDLYDNFKQKLTSSSQSNKREGDHLSTDECQDQKKSKPNRKSEK